MLPNRHFFYLRFFFFFYNFVLSKIIFIFNSSKIYRSIEVWETGINEIEFYLLFSNNESNPLFFIYRNLSKKLVPLSISSPLDNLSQFILQSAYREIGKLKIDSFISKSSSAYAPQNVHKKYQKLQGARYGGKYNYRLVAEAVEIARGGTLVGF